MPLPISPAQFAALTFDNDEEAQALANDTDYGLFVSLWTQNRGTSAIIYAAFGSGDCDRNSGSALSHRTPWDGFKQSGFGRRYGEVGLEPFFEYPTVRVS